MSAASPNQGRDLAWLLRGLGEQVPVIRGSVLLSSDGMMKASDGFDRAGAEHLAALASGLFSIARSAGTKFDDSNEVRQVVAELKSSQFTSPGPVTIPCSRCSPERRPTRPSWVLRWPG